MSWNSMFLIFYILFLPVYIPLQSSYEKFILVDKIQTSSSNFQHDLENALGNRLCKRIFGWKSKVIYFLRLWQSKVSKTEGATNFWVLNGKKFFLKTETVQMKTFIIEASIYFSGKKVFGFIFAPSA
jgi:hypothetical protein